MISTSEMCENSLKNMDYQDHQDHPSEVQFEYNLT